jgi:hypothetical protein
LEEWFPRWSSGSISNLNLRSSWRLGMLCGSNSYMTPFCSVWILINGEIPNWQLWRSALIRILALGPRCKFLRWSGWLITVLLPVVGESRSYSVEIFLSCLTLNIQMLPWVNPKPQRLLQRNCANLIMSGAMNTLPLLSARLCVYLLCTTG